MVPPPGKSACHVEPARPKRAAHPESLAIWSVGLTPLERRTTTPRGVPCQKIRRIHAGLPHRRRQAPRLQRPCRGSARMDLYIPRRCMTGVLRRSSILSLLAGALLLVGCDGRSEMLGRGGDGSDGGGDVDPPIYTDFDGGTTTIPPGDPGCDLKAYPAITLEEVKQAFRAQMYPKLTVCAGCHRDGSGRRFLYADTADETFDLAMDVADSHSLSRHPHLSILGRLMSKDPAVRMPKGGQLSDADIAAVDEVTCKLKAYLVNRCGSGGPTPSESPIRRLTRLEYNNTVRALLAEASEPATAWNAEGSALGFSNNVQSLSVSPELARQIFMTAEDVTSPAKLTAAELTALLPCAATGGEACARQFISDFGLRAYRRPVEPAEVTRLVEVWKVGNAAAGFERGARMVIHAMLVSPHFLYRIERGNRAAPGEVVQLTSYEMASRLSYFLWGSMPDKTLLDEAAANRLTTAAQISAQAKRLFDAASPDAKRMAWNFHAEWLGLNSISTLTRDGLTNWTTLRGPMRQETLKLAETVFWEKGDERQLFTSDEYYLTPALGTLYGVSGVTGNYAATKMPPERRGLMTQASILAINSFEDSSSPIHRGKFVREKLLCQPLGTPPDDVPPLPAAIPGQTTRERLSTHSGVAACSMCHKSMDPIGFGLEGFDQVGRYRTSEQGKAVDTSGAIFATMDIDGSFNGPVELAERLAKSEEVGSCIATQWFRFAHGREYLPLADSCSMEQALAAYRASNFNPRELVLAITQSDAFRYRRVSGGTP